MHFFFTFVSSRSFLIWGWWIKCRLSISADQFYRWYFCSASFVCSCYNFNLTILNLVRYGSSVVDWLVNSYVTGSDCACSLIMSAFNGVTRRRIRGKRRIVLMYWRKRSRKILLGWGSRRIVLVLRRVFWWGSLGGQSRVKSMKWNCAFVQ